MRLRARARAGWFHLTDRATRWSFGRCRDSAQGRPSVIARGGPGAGTVVSARRAAAWQPHEFTEQTGLGQGLLGSGRACANRRPGAWPERPAFPPKPREEPVATRIPLDRIRNIG